MTSDDLIVSVDKLVGSVGRKRRFRGDRPVNLRLGDSKISGPMSVDGIATGTYDGVDTKFEVSATAALVCTRCLTEWEEDILVAGSQYFRIEPDEDGYSIVGGAIDVGRPAQDELALALPATPLCTDKCLGLCPTCGTDLNREPCDGHGNEPDSPFTVLKDLFDS